MKNKKGGNKPDQKGASLLIWLIAASVSRSAVYLTVYAQFTPVYPVCQAVLLPKKPCKKRSRRIILIPTGKGGRREKPAVFCFYHDACDDPGNLFR
jgi:hypothetical protein